MAKAFQIIGAEDEDLALLVDNFLQSKPNYLPVSSPDGTLVFLPCPDNTVWTEEVVCREWPFSDAAGDNYRTRAGLLM